MEDTFIRNIDGSFSKAVVGSGHTVVGCTLPLNDGLSIEVGEAEPTTITETTPETSRWIGRDVYELIRACDEALNWADANARWFDISTAPWLKDVDSEYDYRSPDSGNGIGQVYKTGLFDDDLREWSPDVHVGDVFYQRNGAVSKPTHWREPLPPPSNPPLPEPLEALGAVLRRVKGCK